VALAEGPTEGDSQEVAGPPVHGNHQKN